MSERPSPEDLANKAERDAAYWREEERAAIVGWLRGEAMEAEIRVCRDADEVREARIEQSAYDDAADAIERGDHLVRENITPENNDG